jgi:uncharacterized protein YndB with AHSA1/START domain
MRDWYEGRRPTTSVERVIAAPAGRLWPLFTDPDLPARFSHEYQGGHWIDGADGPAVGARFVGRNHRRSLGTWETVCHVIECQPPTRYAWAVADPDAPNAVWRFEAEPAAGGTTLRYTVVLGPGRSGLTWAIRQQPERRDELIAMRLDDLRRNMTAVVDGIAQLAEGNA